LAAPDGGIAIDVPAIVWQSHAESGAAPQNNGQPCAILVIQNTYVAYVNGDNNYGVIPDPGGGQAIWNFHSRAAGESDFTGPAYNSLDINAELHDVRGADVGAAISVIEGVGLRTAGRGGISDVVSCVGLEYCPLAVAHSMTMGEELALAFAMRRGDPRYADFRIHVSGCPHSCAKHQVADIGLAGAMTEHEGKRVEAFALNIGGNARERCLAAVYPKKIPRVQVIDVVEGLLAEYERHALPGERFSETVARAGSDVFFHAVAAVLSGTALPPPEATVCGTTSQSQRTANVASSR
jgi:hypothetical protein